MTRRLLWVLCAALFVFAGCGRVTIVVRPSDGELSAIGFLRVVVQMNRDADLSTLQVTLDGDDVTSQLDVSGTRLMGWIDVQTLGSHSLVVAAEVDGVVDRSERDFETIAYAGPDGCDPLNQVECLLPFPSSHYLTRDPTTATGRRLNLPAAGMPELHPPLDPAPLNELDGFSPGVQVIMGIPQGVDLALSDAARLIAPDATTPGPPWAGVRTYSARSLDPDSPSLLIDADTGERILHFLELDARAVGVPERQALVLRPGVSLVPGHRYIVALRNLIDPTGVPVEPEAVFAGIREGRHSSIPAVARTSHRLWAKVFPPLVAYEGIHPVELILAFDFVVQSEDQLTRQMLAMRDQGYAWLDDRAAEIVAGDESTFTWSVDAMEDFDCSVPGQLVARRLAGTYASPLFLDGDLDGNSVQFHTVDENDIPVQNGVTQANYTIALPCSLVGALPESPAPDLLLLGHGLFGTGASMIGGIQDLAGLGSSGEFPYVAAATDWRGLSAFDVLWLGGQILGFGPPHGLNDFKALPDRLRQGMLNTLVLVRMMKSGVFNADARFHVDGTPAFAGPDTLAVYDGISLGGIMGTWLAALTPDVERFGLDVPGINFSLLLQRSTQFTLFETLLVNQGLEDPLDMLLGLGLLHELWVSAEPMGYARHVTRDPLPGSGDPKQVLVMGAWLDKQVSNLATELLARTLNVPTLTSSLMQGFAGIPDVRGPVPSGTVFWDTGSFDILDPAHDPFIPALANEIPSPVCDPHSVRPSIPAGVDQLFHFLREGEVIDTCDGVCDAGSPTERPGGLPPEELCSPI